MSLPNYKLRLKEGHRHVVKLNKNGSGTTSIDNRHSHKVRNNKVLPAGKSNHVHSLIKIRQLLGKKSDERIKELKKKGFEVKIKKTKDGDIILKRKK